MGSRISRSCSASSPTRPAGEGAGQATWEGAPRQAPASRLRADRQDDTSHARLLAPPDPCPPLQRTCRECLAARPHLAAVRLCRLVGHLGRAIAGGAQPRIQLLTQRGRRLLAKAIQHPLCGG